MKIGDRELTAAVSCRVWCLFLLLVLALLDVAAVGEDCFLFLFHAVLGSFSAPASLCSCRTVAPSFPSILGAAAGGFYMPWSCVPCCPVVHCCLFFLRARVPHAHDSNPHANATPPFPCC
ncbi:hypothetical protein TcCL_Unassigned02169 [Trypanosoma cruzi]|nr:hypothetical protein TcCL_Unassigned02169 [Trypanosoma cruzi]